MQPMTFVTVAFALATFALAGWFRPMRLARLAPFVLVAHALLVLWTTWSARLDTSGLLAANIAINVIIGLVELAALVAVASHPRDPIALLGTASWALAWLLQASTMIWLVAFLLEVPRAGEMPDTGCASAIAYAVGGFVLAIACALRVERSRRRFLLLLVGLYGLLALLGAFAERRLLDLASTDFDLVEWESRRLLRDVTDAIWLFALAALLRTCDRWKAADPVPRATALR
jgi:hypothetical protein